MENYQILCSTVHREIICGYPQQSPEFFANYHTNLARFIFVVFRRLLCDMKLFLIFWIWRCLKAIILSTSTYDWLIRNIHRDKQQKLIIKNTATINICVQHWIDTIIYQIYHYKYLQIFTIHVIVWTVNCRMSIDTW